MADIPSWDPHVAQRLVDAQSEEIKRLTTERNAFRDAYRREIVRNASGVANCFVSMQCGGVDEQ
jgi:hypothetical protein